MGFSALSIFGPAPSKEEAMEAVHDLQMISLPTTISHFVGDEVNFSDGEFDRTPLLHEKGQRKSSSNLDLSQPGQHVCNLGSVISQAQHKILNALRLLSINPSVKNMVVSLSADKAVWNAVMKNEMVQELKKTYHADKFLKHVEYASRGSKTQWPDGSPDITALILCWFFGIAKAVVMKFIDDIISLVNKLFDQQVKENTTDISRLFPARGRTAGRPDAISQRLNIASDGYLVLCDVDGSNASPTNAARSHSCLQGAKGDYSWVCPF